MPDLPRRHGTRKQDQCVQVEVGSVEEGAHKGEERLGRPQARVHSTDASAAGGPNPVPPGGQHMAKDYGGRRSIYRRFHEDIAISSWVVNPMRHATHRYTFFD